MSKPIVVVFTGNSNTGASAIEVLLKDYADAVTIRAIVRGKAEKEEVLAATDGAVEVIIGDIAKPLILAPCFEGASAAYFATPSTLNRAELSKYFIDACIEHGVKHGIIMSYVGSETQATAYHRQFHEIEQYAAKRAGVPVKIKMGDKGNVKFSPTIVRSVPFYQNFYGCLASIQSGTLYYPLDDKKLTHVDFNDVGKIIALCLADPEPHSGKTYDIIGQSMAGNMIASQIRMKVGIDCNFETVDDEIAVQAFLQLGLQEWIARGNVEMLKFIREGGMEKYGEGDYKALTNEEPMKFSQFVKDELKALLT